MMNLIFVNTFEKKTEGNRVQTAQVSISEHQGAWQVCWTEPNEGGKPATQIWFDGLPWTEMLDAFRSGVKAKTAEGFIPLIEDYDGREGSRMQGSRRTLVMSFFADTHGNEDALQALRLWRRQQARQEGKAAYIVATNRLLQMLAAFIPHTSEELAQIPGMGENRQKSYGKAILDITRTVPKTVEYPLDWVEAGIDEAKFREWVAAQEYRRVKQEQDRLEIKKRLLEAITQGSGLSSLAESTRMNRRDIVLAVEEFGQEGYDVSAWVDEELQSVSNEELLEADRLFQELGDRYLKPVATRMIGKEEREPKEIERLYEWLRLYRMKYRRQAGENATSESVLQGEESEQATA
jgi:hypothetical protein